MAVIRLFYYFIIYLFLYEYAHFSTAFCQPELLCLQSIKQPPDKLLQVTIKTMMSSEYHYGTMWLQRRRRNTPLSCIVGTLRPSLHKSGLNGWHDLNFLWKVPHVHFKSTASLIDWRKSLSIQFSPQILILTLNLKPLNDSRRGAPHFVATRCQCWPAAVIRRDITNDSWRSSGLFFHCTARERSLWTR